MKIMSSKIVTFYKKSVLDSEHAEFLNRCRDEDVEKDRRILEDFKSRHYMPREVFVQISRACNLKCSMCGWGAWGRNSGTMDFDLFKRVVDELLANGYIKINFTGAQGEPMLNPRFEEYVSYAMERGLSVFLSTNCTTLSKKNIDKLCELSIKGNLSLIASFAGYDKKSYEEVYVGANFKMVSRNLQQLLERLREMGRADILNIRGVVVNSDQAKKTMGFLEGLGYDQKHIDLVLPDNFGGLSLLGDLDPALNAKSCKPQLGDRPLRLCGWILDTILIYDDGDVTACGCRDSEGALKIGNISTQSLSEIRSGEKYIGFINKFMSRDLSSMPLCASCDVPYGDIIHYPDYIRQADHSIEDGDYLGAIDSLNRLDGLYKNLGALDRMCRAQLNLGNNLEALRVNRLMKDLSPLDPNIIINEADIYIAMQRFGDALAIYKELLSNKSVLLARPIDNLVTTVEWLLSKVD